MIVFGDDLAFMVICPTWWNQKAAEDRNILTSFFKKKRISFFKKQVLLEFPDCLSKELCLSNNENKFPEEVNAVLKKLSY